MKNININTTPETAKTPENAPAVKIAIGKKTVSVTPPAKTPGTDAWRLRVDDNRRNTVSDFIVADFAREIGRAGVAVRNVCRDFDLYRPARRWTYDTTVDVERAAAATLVALCVRRWPDTETAARKYARETGAVKSVDAPDSDKK